MENTESNSATGDVWEGRLAKFCLDNASVCALRLNQDGRIIYANRKACDSLGYTQEELLGMTVFDIDPMETQDRWPDAWQRICAAGSVTIESLHRRKDGSLFPVEVTATLIEFEGHRYSMALINDITDRKRLLESLRIAKFMFERASFGIFLTKEDGRIANVNAHACQHLGYTHDELCRMNILEVDRGLSVEARKLLWLQLRESGAANFESVHQRKDGSQMPVMITVNRLEFNNEVYGVTFVQDLTEKKKAEKQRLKMEAHVRNAQKMESLGTLAGGIAHDFNNILAAILGYADLAALESPAGTGLKQYIDQISLAGRRAKDLVNQILTFSRQGQSEKRPIDISRSIGEALKLLKATLPRTIEIRENILPRLAPVFADETQIHQIVMNLCANAHYAMKTTGGVLDVGLTTATISEQDSMAYPDMKPGRYLKLTVADTGSGIAPDLADRIFEPYFTSKPAGEGTGMGLSTVHGIVKDHGGSIKVYSEAGVGTTFNVFLPVVGTFTETYEEHAQELPTGWESILFVDDEKSLIDLGRDLLERLGYRVETRASAIDAIEAFRSDPQKYDLIISDMTMPKMAGDELASQMRSIRPDIPIILCSGFSEALNTQAMETIGAYAILRKPITYADLAKTVRMVLDTK